MSELDNRKGTVTIPRPKVRNFMLLRQLAVHDFTSLT